MLEVPNTKPLDMIVLKNTMENMKLINNSADHVGSTGTSLSAACTNGNSLKLLQYL